MGNACICGQNDETKSKTNGLIKSTTKEDERLIKLVSNKIAKKVIKSICKLAIKNNKEIINIIGFFIKLSESLKYIFTNSNIINVDLINENIEIEIWNKDKIYLNPKELYYKYFEKQDITIIEINELNNNKFEDIVFLDYDYNYMKKYLMYKNMDVFSLLNPFNKDAICVSGLIINIDNYKFIHNIPIENDSTGCPIILFNNYINLIQVIGIHKNTDQIKRINYGTFIGEIICEIKDDSNFSIISNNNDIKINQIINLPKEDSTKEEKSNLTKIQNDDFSKNEKIVSTETKEIKKEKKIKKKDNFIIGEIYIKDEDVNKSIRIIYSYEEYMNCCGDSTKKIEENIMNICEIRINHELIKFNYYHTFPKKGKYKIKYKFKRLLVKANYVFYECPSLISLDLSQFNSANVTDMSNMFYNCSSLLNINLSDLNAENAMDMSYMFCNCSSLRDIDLTDFNSQNVNDMHCMFSGCSSLKNINLSYFNTQNVVKMNHIFSFCSSLKNINLSNFNFQNVRCMCYMFYNCSSLESINFSNFEIGSESYIFHCCNQNDFSCMFQGCTILKGNVITNDKKIIEILNKLNY